AVALAPTFCTVKLFSGTLAPERLSVGCARAASTVSVEAQVRRNCRREECISVLPQYQFVSSQMAPQTRRARLRNHNCPTAVQLQIRWEGALMPSIVRIRTEPLRQFARRQLRRRTRHGDKICLFLNRGGKSMQQTLFRDVTLRPDLPTDARKA